MSSISKRRREGSRSKIKSIGGDEEFLTRITKTLYYGQLPSLPCLSLPVTEISCEVWSVAQRGRSLRRLRADAAASVARGACVSPCALVLALLYLERLNACNPDYIAAAAPADLFLVSLMVGNKFLQDDGEDDDVICSEWAASGGMELKQLKKLEVEFLNAIDWNVFVSKKSFEAGLHWLERQVALRQAQSRGFFTYTDLAALCGGAQLAELGAAARLALALALAYLASLASLAAFLASLLDTLAPLTTLTTLTTTLLVSRATLPTLHLIPSTTLATSPLNTDIVTTNFQPEFYVNNATLDRTVPTLAPDTLATDKLKCCTKWVQYQEATTSKKNWHDAVILYDWKLEWWWSKTSFFNWLYQSSLVNPVQRWLERVNEYVDLLKREFVRDESMSQEGTRGRCNGYVTPEAQQRCVRQWLNLSKLSVWAATVSDR